jgi:hypothetical protein
MIPVRIPQTRMSASARESVPGLFRQILSTSGRLVPDKLAGGHCQLERRLIAALEYPDWWRCRQDLQDWTAAD